VARRVEEAFRAEHTVARNRVVAWLYSLSSEQVQELRRVRGWYSEEELVRHLTPSQTIFGHARVRVEKRPEVALWQVRYATGIDLIQIPFRWMDAKHFGAQFQYESFGDYAAALETCAGAYPLTVEELAGLGPDIVPLPSFLDFERGRSRCENLPGAPAQQPARSPFALPLNAMLPQNRGVRRSAERERDRERLEREAYLESLRPSQRYALPDDDLDGEYETPPTPAPKQEPERIEKPHRRKLRL